MKVQRDAIEAEYIVADANAEFLVIGLKRGKRVPYILRSAGPYELHERVGLRRVPGSAQRHAGDDGRGDAVRIRQLEIPALEIASAVQAALEKLGMPDFGE
jgi:hypothetical protein